MKHHAMEATEPVLRFLAALACQGPPNALAAAFERASRTASPREIVGVAAHFGLTALLGEFVATIPAPLRKPGLRDLVVHGLRAEARSAAQLQLLGRLVNRPEVRGAESIAVKGAALVLAGITTPGRRNFVDVDLLVDPETLDRWREAALAVGATHRAGAGGYERGYVSDGPALIELHVALPGPAGTDPGPSFDEVLASSVPCQQPEAFPGVCVPAPTAMREIAVHHFLHHHGGEPSHALRVLQDLALLEGTRGPSPLRWGHDPLDAEVERLAGIARSLRSGDLGAPLVTELVERLVPVTRPELIDSFADHVDRWLAGAPKGNAGRVGLLLRRLVPPGAEIGISPGMPVFRKAALRLRRPFTLLHKYGTARFEDLQHRRHRQLVREWKAFLAGKSGR